MRPTKVENEPKRYKMSYVFTVTGDISVTADTEREARMIFAKWGTRTRLSRGGDWKVGLPSVEEISEERYLADVAAQQKQWEGYVDARLARVTARNQKRNQKAQTMAAQVAV